MARAVLLALLALACAAMPRAAGAWSATEDWVLTQLKQGEVADLAQSPGCVNLPVEGQAACRNITGRFVRSLLTTQKLKDLPRGMRLQRVIVSPDVPDPDCPDSVVAVALPFADIELPVEIADSDLRGGVCLAGARLASTLSLRNSRIRGNVNMSGIGTKSAVVLDSARIDGGVEATLGHFGESLTLRSARVSGGVSLNASHVGGSLRFDDGNFGGDCHKDCTLDLVNAHIDRTLVMARATFHQRVAASGLRVDRDLLVQPEAYIRNISELSPRACPPMASTVFKAPVNLRTARVGGQLSLSGGVFLDDIDLRGANITATVHGEGGCGVETQFHRRLRLERAAVGDSLLLGGSELRRVAIDGARIAKELRLERQGAPARWVAPGDGPSELSLLDASVPVIRDAPCAWPERLRLEGFTYNRPPVYTPQGMPAAACGEQAIEPRSRAWWTGWLARDPDRSLQTYRQLAAALASVGQPVTSDDMRYDGRYHEMTTSSGADRLWDWTLFAFVGFGIGYHRFRGLVWAVALAAVAGLWLHGTIVGRRLAIDANPPPRRLVLRYMLRDPGEACRCFAATLQHILPVINIDTALRDWLASPPVRPTGLLRVVFGLLAIFGFLVGGLLISAWAGFIGT
ncbi:hypothetical protein [Methylocella sp.]|uniref:hypothetical protein n=1 Tax=Methylocella sp. TaxID=1978226 RepID=UPI0037842CD8